ncbi:MAG: 4'-phosphopantetheinyl transferase superfamily protein [Candidatus Sericytochromatia bacterium]|nr:4'-phosphopantetheinyl transferase superfamily protein [Candidatus Sericytochromatia bacterium]
MSPDAVLVVLRGTPAALVEAEAVLTAAEAERLRELRVEKRRRDWLLGRLAAKQAAAGLLGPRPLAGLQVEVTPGGAPRLHHAESGAPGPAISISHSGGCAAALASHEPVGVDLEALQPMPAGAARYYLSEVERAWLAERPWGPHSELIAWALKEAAYKALGGAPGGLTRLTLAPASDANPGAWLAHDGGRLRGQWAAAAGFCLAVASADPAAGGPLQGLDLEGGLAVLAPASP